MTDAEAQQRLEWLARMDEETAHAIRRECAALQGNPVALKAATEAAEGHEADAALCRHALQAIADRAAFLRVYDDASVDDPMTIFGCVEDDARRHMRGEP